MALFDVDFTKVVKNTLPVRLRGAAMQAWLVALLAPVIYAYNLFRANRANNLYRLAHNSQVCYMQAVLNDKFDNVLRRIIIVDAGYRDPIYIYQSIEDKDVGLYMGSENQPVYLYTAGEIGAGVYDFIVQVPATISFQTPQMRAVIDTYRLVSKSNYLIQRI